jgi:hypothetical protein
MERDRDGWRFRLETHNFQVFCNTRFTSVCYSYLTF